MFVHLVEAAEHGAEVIRADRQHRREADGRVHGVAAADPVPELEHVGGVDAECRHCGGVGRDCHEVLRDRGLVAAEAGEQPRARSARVGHRFERGEGLGRDDEERLRWVEIVDRFDEIRAIDVRNEPEREVAVAVVPERFIGHDRAQVGPADSDIDDVADWFAGVAFPFAGANTIREPGHPVEHGMDPGHDILAVDQNRRAARCTQRDVQHGAVLGDVDLLATKHGIDPPTQPGLFGETEEQRQRLIGDPVLRIVEINAGGLRRQPFATAGIARKKLAEMNGADLVMVFFERPPGWPLGDSSGADGHGMLSGDGRERQAARRDRARPGDRRAGASCHRRKPPMNAFALSPRQPFGSAFSFFAFPPPITTSSG